MTGNLAEQVTGYVLAGGRSSRMGQDKALVDLHGVPLIEHALQTLRGTCGQVRILSGPPDSHRDALLSRYATLVPDGAVGAVETHFGPLAALAAALHDCTSPYALLLAVDQPGITAETLNQLVRVGVAAQAAAASFQIDGQMEPVPLLISRDLHAAVAGALRSGERRLLQGIEAAAHTAARVFLHPAPPPSATRQFANLNTPGDLERFCAQTSSNHSAVPASEQRNG